MIAPFEIGICSWSLKTARESELRAAMERLGVSILHLALAPLTPFSNPADSASDEQFQANVNAKLEMAREFEKSPLRISAGMIAFPGEDYSTLATIRATGGLVPDATAEARLLLAGHCGQTAMRMGINVVSTHVGFVPRAADDAAAFKKLLQRIGKLADAYKHFGATLLFETGQETAADLRAFLTALDRDNVGVNFDPANMLLYGKGDPVEAIDILSPWIEHVHLKDTKLHSPAPVGDAWRGRECPLGQGDAKLAEVIGALKRIGYAGPLIIEREAVGVREADVNAGIEFLRAQLK